MFNEIRFVPKLHHVSFDENNDYVFNNFTDKYFDKDNENLTEKFRREHGRCFYE